MKVLKYQNKNSIKTYSKGEHLMKSIKLTTIALTMMASSLALADWQPSGPIKLLIGFGAGGTTDLSGRAVAAAIEKQTGWRVIAENKPGGGGVAMLAGLSKAKADGQSIGLSVNVPLLLGMALKGEDKMPVTLDKIDFLGTTSKVNIGLIAPADAPYNTMDELVEYAKTTEVKIGFDAPPQKMVYTAIANDTGAKFAFVPFKSSGDILPAVLGKHIDAGSGTGLHVPYLKSGEVKMVTSLNATRHSASPNVKTLQEQGYNYALDPVFFFAAPKGMPADAKMALAKAIDNAVNSNEVKDIIKKGIHVNAQNFGPQGTEELLRTNYKAIKILVAGIKKK